MSKPNKQQIEKLVSDIKSDQAKLSPAEKRVKIKTDFGSAVKKMAKTPPPKKKIT